MPESLKMILVLTLISGVAGLGLYAVNRQTASPIEENARRFTLRSINRVMPDADNPEPGQNYPPVFDNAPDRDAVCLNGMTIYRGRRIGEITALAVRSVGEQAYSGTITVLVGLRFSDGVLLGVEVLEHAETPGLGDKMAHPAFQKQMVGLGPDDLTWYVQKDGGDIDQLTGATITSRSFLQAVRAAQELWETRRDDIRNAEAMKKGDRCDVE